VDDGISGAEFVKRPGFLRLMNALKPKPPFQILIMSAESRLGRDQIETAYALKQIITAGVRIFYYLEDRERVLESPTDKLLLSVTAFADEMEREKARQRTHDALVRKARAEYVAGGSVYGYDNVEVAVPDPVTGRGSDFGSRAGYAPNGAADQLGIKRSRDAGLAAERPEDRLARRVSEGLPDSTGLQILVTAPPVEGSHHRIAGRRGISREDVVKHAALVPRRHRTGGRVRHVLSAS
jgi:hypothetical protein